MKPRHRRFLWIGAGVAALGVAVALVLNAFQSNLVFFFTPSQVVAQGTLAPDGSFHATEVLAKHDENYMPPAAKDAIDQAHRSKAMAMPSMKTPEP